MFQSRKCGAGKSVEGLPSQLHQPTCIVSWSRAGLVIGRVGCRHRHRDTSRRRPWRRPRRRPVRLVLSTRKRRIIFVLVSCVIWLATIGWFWIVIWRTSVFVSGRGTVWGTGITVLIPGCRCRGWLLGGGHGQHGGFRFCSLASTHQTDDTKGAGTA